MLAKIEPSAAVVDEWLAQFERALNAADGAALEALFDPESHWRDILALTWRIATYGGRAAIV